MKECNLTRQSEFVSASLDTFGVLCHGDLWRQNVLFFYGSGAGSVIECQTDCLDVRYSELMKEHRYSCSKKLCSRLKKQRTRRSVNPLRISIQV